MVVQLLVSVWPVLQALGPATCTQAAWKRFHAVPAAEPVLHLSSRVTFFAFNFMNIL